MSKAKKTGTKKSATRSAKGTAAGREDAIALLKADHRQVEAWFEEFDSTNSSRRKQKLAQSICQALTVHTTIEEEIFHGGKLTAAMSESGCAVLAQA